MARSTSQPPNILFAIADDASHFGAFGHAWVNTPNIDGVAAQGVRFQNAFTTNPKCAPSRAGILTGMHTWQLEEACNHWNVFPSKFAVYPNLLEEAGYFVGFTGKGWGPGDWKEGGFARNPAGPEFTGRTLVPPSSTISKKDYAGNFADFLEARPDDAPFCFWYGGHEPHRRYEEGEGLRAGKRLEDACVPAFLPDDDIVKSDLLDYAFEIEWFDSQLGIMLGHLEAAGELDNTIVIVTSDNGMPFPRVKGQMYDADFHLPMVGMWRARGKAERVVEDFISFVDFAPTFLEAGGVDIPDAVSGTSFLDIFTSDKDGWIDESRDQVFMGRERHDVGRRDDKGYPVRCLRTKGYLYIRNFEPDRWPSGNPETGFTDVDSSPTKSLILDQHERGNDRYFDLIFAKRPREELYHTIEDPECLHNLADDPEHHQLLEAMWEALKFELESTRDPRLSGRGDSFDRFKYVGDAPHSWANYEAGTWKPQRY